MKIIKWAFLCWVACATLLFSLAIHIDQPITRAHTFCAYNKVFVEFDEDGKKWGTIMLDSNGRPIHCKEDDVEELSVNIKETI